MSFFRSNFFLGTQHEYAKIPTNETNFSEDSFSDSSNIMQQPIHSQPKSSTSPRITCYILCALITFLFLLPEESPNFTMKQSRFIIIFGTYNTPDRTDMYYNTLNWYVHNSTFELVVVDSFGVGFNISHPRVHYCVYNQSNHKIHWWRFKSNSELLSLQMATDQYHELFDRFEYVVKMTGKYVLPDLKYELDKIPVNGDIDWIIQSREGKAFRVTTEVFGVKSTMWNSTLHRLKTSIPAWMVEIRMGYILVADGYFYHKNNTWNNGTEEAENDRVLRLPPLRIPKKYWLIARNSYTTFI